jgi:hypothetical protein
LIAASIVNISLSISDIFGILIEEELSKKELSAIAYAAAIVNLNI